VQSALAGRDDLQIVAISPGAPELLRRLRDGLGLSALLLTDPSWHTYRAYGLGRASIARLLLSPRLWLAYAALLLKGRRPARPTEDVHELGGDALVDAEGNLAWIHRSASVDDRPSPAEILRRVEAL
jgi:hypothetical protein